MSWPLARTAGRERKGNLRGLRTPRMVADTHTLADALPQGSHAAVIDVKSGHTVQASSLRALVLSAAATLRASGVQPGQVVSIVDANTVSQQLWSSDRGQQAWGR